MGLGTLLGLGIKMGLGLGLEFGLGLGLGLEAVHKICKQPKGGGLGLAS